MTEVVIAIGTTIIVLAVIGFMIFYVMAFRVMGQQITLQSEMHASQQRQITELQRAVAATIDVVVDVSKPDYDDRDANNSRKV